MIESASNTPIAASLEQMARAFEAWENDFRVDPSLFLSAEESAAQNVSTLSASRASYFYALLGAVKTSAAP